MGEFKVEEHLNPNIKTLAQPGHKKRHIVARSPLLSFHDWIGSGGFGTSNLYPKGTG